MKQCKFNDTKKYIKEIINLRKYKILIEKGASSKIINQILQEVEKNKKVTISSDEKIKLLAYIKDLFTSTEYEKQVTEVVDTMISEMSHYTLSGVSAPDKVHGEDLDFFEVSIEKDKAFVPGINEVLSATVKQDIIVKLKSKLLFTSNGKISINSEDISRELIYLKREELRKIIDWLVNNRGADLDVLPTITSIMDTSIDPKIRYSNYHKLMSICAKNLHQYINTFPNHKVTERLSQQLRNNFLDVLESFLLLQNFDTFVEHFIGDDINIAPKFKGDFLSQDLKKYTIKSDSYFEHSFQDDLTQDNGAHTTPHIVKLFFSTIRTGEEGTEFLSNQDHRQLVSFINHMWTDEYLDNYTRNSLRKLYLSRDADSEYESLIEVLESKKFKDKYKSSKQQAIIRALKEYYEAVKKTEAELNIEELEYFTRHRNVIHALVHSIQSQKAAVFVATTENGNVINTAVDRSTSKKQVYDAIKVAARNNFTTGQDILVYSSVFSVADGKSAQGITDIYSVSAKQMIFKILGQSIPDEILQEIEPSLVGDALTAVQQKYSKHVGPHLNITHDQLEAALNNFITDLYSDSRMKKFTDKLVEKETAQIKKVYTQEMDPLPGENINSILTDSERNIEQYLESFKKIREKSGNNNLHHRNVIISEDLHKMRESLATYNDRDKFISHNCFRSDVKVVDSQGKSKVVSHTQLEPSELSTVSLNYDWIQSLIDGDVFFLQTETYSDKPRVLIHSYNFAGKVLSREDKLGKNTLIDSPFYTKSIEQLQDIHYTQQKAYYDAIEADVVNNWNAIKKYLPKYKNDRFSSIDDILEYISSEELKYLDFKNAIIQYQINPNNPPINFIEHYDYINNKGDVTMNESLIYKIKTLRDKDTFLKDQEYGFNKYIDSINTNGNVPVLLSNIEDDQKLKEILGLTTDQWKGVSEEALDKYLKVIKDAKTWNPEDKSKAPIIPNGITEQDLFIRVLKKYHTTQALLQDADLQLGIKSPWLHIPKGVTYKSAEQLQYLLQIDMTSEKLSDADSKFLQEIRIDYSKRLVAGKKRNSSGVATSTPQKQGERFGVPDQMKVIMASFPKQKVENHIGKKDNLKPHDGVSYVFGIYSQYEENSYPNHDYLGTRKTIGLIPHFGSFTQVKHAENTLTNELLRGMAHRDVDYEFNPENLIRIGYEPCKLTKRFIHNFSKKENRKEFESNGIFYNFNGNIARLVDIDCKEEDEKFKFKFTWTYVEGEALSGDVNQPLINQMIGVNADADGYVEMDNLLQLYKALGSYNSMSYNEFGNIVPSEISNIACARLISYYDVDPEKYFNDPTFKSDEPSMKKTMVAKIIDPESCKSGQIAVNSAEDLRKGTVAYGYLDTSRWGIQQDYTHETVDAKIPALTQVITAIAFNGNNIELVANLYQSLGKIISDSLRPILNMNGHSDEVNYYLGKKLIKSLQKNSVASNAQELVKNFLDSIIAEMKDPALSEDRMKDGRLPITLSLSNSDIFYKVTSDLVSNLNKDTIRQEFDGIAVIQCPSQGVVMLYEDHDGNSYKRSDVVKMAQKSLKERTILSGQTSVTVGIDSEGKEIKQDISSYLFTEDRLLDWYFNYTEEGRSLFGDIEITPQNIDILNIGDHVVIQKFGLNENYYIDTPADLRDLYSLVNNEDIKIIKKYSEQRDLGVTKITWTEEGGFKNNLFCIESTRKLIENGDDKEAKAWHRANLKGLASKSPYYYKTYEDFLNKKETRVFDVKHKAGQQIIPKKYSLFEEQDYSLAEIRSNPEFFLNLARKRYTLSTPLNAQRKYGIATSFGDIIFDDSKIEETELNTDTVKDDSNNTYYITDKVGNRLLEVPGLNYKGILTTAEDGKKVMIIKIEGEYSNEKFDEFVEKARKVLDRRGLINAYYYYEDNETKVNYKLSKFKQDASIDENIEYIARGLRKSWELSHITISTRIPSQSFQSFLWTETVGYTDTTDYNLGYMNIWEMWFQGSK